MPMETWNLKLVDIQKAAKHFDGDERESMTETEQAALSYFIDDLTCIPANRKSRFSFESQYAASEQKQHCNRFLAVVGIKSDLMYRPTLIGAPMVDPYQPPRSLDPLIPQQPEHLASDLYRCTTCTVSTITVEDKDPSIHWQMTCNSSFYFCFIFGIPRCPSAHVGPPAADRPSSSKAYDHMPRHRQLNNPRNTNNIENTSPPHSLTLGN